MQIESSAPPSVAWPSLRAGVLSIDFRTHTLSLSTIDNDAMLCAYAAQCAFEYSAERVERGPKVLGPLMLVAVVESEIRTQYLNGHTAYIAFAHVHMRVCVCEFATGVRATYTVSLSCLLVH